jgi:hypothetical protein
MFAWSHYPAHRGAGVGSLFALIALFAHALINRFNRPLEETLGVRLGAFWGYGRGDALGNLRRFG